MKALHHLLIYEPRTEGHHLGWLRFIIEDLQPTNVKLSVAADLRPGKRERVEEQLAGLLSRVKLLSAYDEKGRRHLDGKARSVAHCLDLSGADHVFLCALDEIASSCWRRAAWGISPPAELRGRMGGIYHRPRFFSAPAWSPGRWLKSTGFSRLLCDHWWGQLLFVDEFLAADLRSTYPSAPVFYLPDPCPPGYDGDRGEARRQMQLPPDKFILLFYGTGARRKGLHLAVTALLQLPLDSPVFLFCAGQQNPAGETAAGLSELVRQGRALAMDRYVTVAEEKNCFTAADAVLLPYLNHFGTSGVLSRAMSAGKPVIVSDEQLIGRLTRERGLGQVFRSGDAKALAGCMAETSALDAVTRARLAAAARAYAAQNSRAAFREALLRSLNLL